MHTIVQKTTTGRPRVVIVGAGISGLAVASLLSDVNADVLVLRQAMEPARARQFTGLFDRDDLRALGAAVGEEELLPIREVRRAVGHTPPGAAGIAPADLVSVEHGVVLDALERHAVEEGVQVVDGFTASQLRLTDGVVAGVIGEGRSRTIQADVVVLADESDPRLAEQIGLRPDWLPTELMHLCNERYPASTDVLDARFRAEQGGYQVVTHRFQASWGPWGVGMIVPARAGLTVRVAMLLEDEMASARHIKEYLDEFKAIPPVAAMLDVLNAERFFTEVVPIGGFDEPRRFHADGVLVVSDLLGLTHPLNRDGLSTNLKACAAAALCLESATGKGDFSSGVLSRYSRQLEAEVVRPMAIQRRRSYALRARPTWEWASIPSLLPPLEGVTPGDISETLPEVARRKALHGLAGLGRRVGFRPGSRDVIDE